LSEAEAVRSACHLSAGGNHNRYDRLTEGCNVWPFQAGGSAFTIWMAAFAAICWAIWWLVMIVLSGDDVGIR
jgi:hypothetical protein